MTGQEVSRAVQALSMLVTSAVRAGATTREAWKTWRKEQKTVRQFERWFGYERMPGMPCITSLVAPNFHPTLPLMGLNYTPVAHNTLHAFPTGWTVPLRLCRGIIFDRKGTLVAKPFPKFFNLGEHPETATLRDEPFEATVKHDGHLGIIFAYEGALHFTTRGSFVSSTSLLGQAKLDQLAAKPAWRRRFPEKHTLLVEFIHPKTRVHLNYGRMRRFIAIGAYDLNTLCDCAHDDLILLARPLGWETTERWKGTSLADLSRLVADVSQENREGFVVRYADGTRVKLKFAAYINRMVGAKLSHRYIMQRVVAGNLERMTKNLPEEVRMRMDTMLAELVAAAAIPDARARSSAFKALVPTEECTSYYLTVARAFTAHLGAGGVVR